MKGKDKIYFEVGRKTTRVNMWVVEGIKYPDGRMLCDTYKSLLIAAGGSADDGEPDRAL